MAKCINPLTGKPYEGAHYKSNIGAGVSDSDAIEMIEGGAKLMKVVDGKLVEMSEDEAQDFYIKLTTKAPVLP